MATLKAKERNSGKIMGGEVGCRISGVKNVTLLLQKTSFSHSQILFFSPSLNVL
jgi:hypothetical protein